VSCALASSLVWDECICERKNVHFALLGYRLSSVFSRPCSRNQQINACLSAFLGCRETSSDRSRLEIPFKLSDGLPNAVLVTLPAQFPADPPALAIAAHIQHPWVDPASNLRVPCLDLWGSSSDVRLDTVLLDFIQSLSRFQVFTTSPQRRSPDKSSPQGQSNPRGTPNPMRLPFFGKESNNNDRNDNNNLDMHHLGTPQSSLELKRVREMPLF